MSYKVAVGGIHIESSTFTPYISDKQDFNITRGDELLKRYPFADKYQEQIEFLPTVHARALPGGRVSATFFKEWLEEYLNMLQAYLNLGPLDAVFLDIHGAMFVDGMVDAEGYIATKIREIIGKDIILSASMDLHGNVSDRLFEACDALTCYRTAPHIDVIETRERALQHIITLLKNGKERWLKFKVDIPILLTGEMTSTEVEPAKGLYQQIEVKCSRPEIEDVSIWMGFPWAEEERCHAVVAAYGWDRNYVQDAAEDVANLFWKNREEYRFIGPVASLTAAVDQALSSSEAPFFLSDTGDNPGAGGLGDMNLVLKEFSQRNQAEKITKKVLFASIFDRQAVDILYAKKEDELSQEFSLPIGGKLDLKYGGPLNALVKLEHKFVLDRAGRCAMIRLDNLYVILTENRFQYGSFDYFLKSGVRDFSDFDCIVVKMGYLEPDLSKAAKGWVMALTEGAVSQDFDKLCYRARKKPLYPMEKDAFIGLEELSGRFLK